MNDSPLQDGEGALAVDVVVEADAWRMLPEAPDIVRQAIACAFKSGVEIHCPRAALGTLREFVCVLLCDDATIARLNGQWRGQNKPTNVLSFAAAAPPHRAGPEEKIPLGDIAIAYETLVREAGENGTAVSDHLSHLVVHGFLHLLGYDHHMDDEAERMERLERDILARMGIRDPYAAYDADI